MKLSSRIAGKMVGNAEDALPLIGRLISENAKEYISRYLIAFLCMGVAAAATSAIALSVEFMIDDIFVERNQRMVYIISAAVLLIYIAKGVASYIYMVLLAQIGNNVVARNQQRLYDCILSQGLGFFKKHEFGEIITRISHNAEDAREALNLVVISFGRDFLSLIGLGTVMIIQKPVLSLVALCICPPAIWGVTKLRRRMKKEARAQYVSLSHVAGLVKETILGIRIVKAFLLAPILRKRVKHIISEVEGSANGMAKMEAATSPVMETLGGLAIAAVLLYGGYSIAYGGEDPGSFVSFITALLLAYDPAKRLARLHVNLEGYLVGVRLMYRFMDEKAHEADKKGAKAITIKDGGVSFENVHFCYEASQQALKGVDLFAAPGQMTAIVGPSGAGKSTIFALIERFYEADSGVIRIDGKPIDKFTIKSLREQIALVTQETFLFDGTIGENIAVGREKADEQMIEEAACNSNSHEFISRLQKGYDAPVGEGGDLLSGGQRQRIAIARAMLRDAPILLFDEATSSLDSASEKSIQQALNRLMQGRTTIVIAHRLSTVRNADRIYVLMDGQVVESGTHKQLLAKGKHYKKLYDLQFLDDS